MNHNLTAVSLTVAVLGLIAAFDIIPGAGIYAGVVMLVAGGGLFIALLVLRTWPFLFDARSTPATAPWRPAAEPPWQGREGGVS